MLSLAYGPEHIFKLAPDNEITIHAYIPDIVNSPNAVKYRVVTNLTNETSDDGEVVLLNHFDKPVDISIVLDPPTTTGYYFLLDKKKSRYSFYSLTSSDNSKDDKKVGKRSIQLACGNGCTDTSDSMITFFHRNWNKISNPAPLDDVELPYTYYGFRYKVCVGSISDATCKPYEADPGVKNGGQAQFHDVILRHLEFYGAVLAAVAGSLLVGVNVLRIMRRRLAL